VLALLEFSSDDAQPLPESSIDNMPQLPHWADAPKFSGPLRKRRIRHRWLK
jgi:hypothetical protein